MNGDEKLEIMTVNVDILKVLPQGQREILVISGEMHVLMQETNGSDALLLVVDDGQKFTYALMASVPVLTLPQIGSYIVPSPVDQQQNYQFAIVLKAETPPATLTKFHELVEAFADLKVAKVTDEDAVAKAHEHEQKEDKIASAGNKMASSIQEGTKLLAEGLLSGGRFMAKSMTKGSTYIVSKTDKGRQRKVDPNIKARAKQARGAANVVVKVSSTVLQGALAASYAVSQAAAEAVSETKMGSKLASPSSERGKAAKKVLKESCVGALVLLDALEEAALTVLKASTEASADVIQHKYGDEVGDTARDVGHAVSDMGRAAVSVRRLGAGSLASRCVKSTAIHVLSSEEEKVELQEQAPQVDPITKMAAQMAISNVAVENGKTKP